MPQSQKPHRQTVTDLAGPRAYSLDEAAERLGIGRSLLFDLVRRGEVRTLKLGRRRVVPAAELARLLSGAS